MASAVPRLTRAPALQRQHNHDARAYTRALFALVLFELLHGAPHVQHHQGGYQGAAALALR